MNRSDDLQAGHAHEGGIDHLYLWSKHRKCAGTMSALDFFEGYIRDKIVKERWTHVKLSVHLQRLYPTMKGLSVRSLQRFCQEKDIHKTSRLKSTEVDAAVADAIAKV